MKTQGWQAGALFTAALIVVGAWGIVFVTGPEAAVDVVPTREATAPDEPPAVLFVGDSYTAGAGATDPERGWSAVAANRLGWVELNEGVGGTGYATSLDGADAKAACGEGHCAAYPARVNHLSTEYDPDVVVVSGGRNDAGADGVATGVTATVRGLEREFPAARLVLVAPWWDDETPPAEYVTTRREILTAAREAGVGILDAGEPLRGEPKLVSDDGVHPNDTGHRALATAFVQAWRSR